MPNQNLTAGPRRGKAAGIAFAAFAAGCLTASMFWAWPAEQQPTLMDFARWMLASPWRYTGFAAGLAIYAAGLAVCAHAWAKPGWLADKIGRISRLRRT